MRRKRIHGRGRGFASLPPERRRELASQGGKTAHAKGTAHKWTSEEARAAGEKGGRISRRGHPRVIPTIEQTVFKKASGE